MKANVLTSPRPDTTAPVHTADIAPAIYTQPVVEHRAPEAIVSAPNIEKPRKPITDPRLAKFILHAAVRKNERRYK